MSYVWTCKCEGKVHLPEEQSLAWGRGLCEPPRGPIESRESRREPCKVSSQGQRPEPTKSVRMIAFTETWVLAAAQVHVCLSVLPIPTASVFPASLGPCDHSGPGLQGNKMKAGLCILCPQQGWEAAQGLGGAALQALAGVFRLILILGDGPGCSLAYITAVQTVHNIRPV